LLTALIMKEARRADTTAAEYNGLEVDLASGRILCAPETETSLHWERANTAPASPELAEA
jgi:hypothetical protein